MSFKKSFILKTMEF